MIHCQGGKLRRCSRHEDRRAPVPSKKCGDPLTGSYPCRVTSGRGRGEKRRRAGTEAVYNAPDGSVPKILVLPLPVRVKLLRYASCGLCLAGTAFEGKSAGQEASTGVWIQKCGVLWERSETTRNLNTI